MKLKLIFPYPAWKNVSNKYYISIQRNKIDNYIGLHPIKDNLISKQQHSEKLINSTFDIYKLDKLDRKELNTKATHEIVSQKLHNIVKGHKYCLKLNWFQEFYINWYHKEYIIQALDFKKSILSGLVGAILGFFSHILIQNLSNNSKQNNAIIESKKNKKTNTQTPIKKIETNNIKISKTDTIK